MKGCSSRSILVLIFASIIRFWGLGGVPAGVSIFEAKLGLYLFQFVGNLALSPFWLRLPFVVVGIATLVLTHNLVLRITKDKNISFIVLSVMAFLPWHIMESRVAGYGIPLLLIFLLTFIFLESRKYDLKKVAFVFFTIFVLIFTIGLTKKDQDLENNLALQRNSLPAVNILYRRIFVNKIIENFRSQEKMIFENIDFGNYFFKGHPRERWGTEETQKLFVVLIPFLLIGLFQFPKSIAHLILSWTLAVFSLILLSSNKFSGVDLSLMIPLIIFIAFGINYLVKSNNKFKKAILTTIFIAGVFELCYFGAEYLSGKSESTFSPRRPVYKELASEILKNKKDNEDVLVTSRLPDASYFLKFYLGSNFNSNFYFEDFNVKTAKEEKRMVVDILPYEPSPSEPLFTNNGKVPEFINLITILDDAKYRQKIYLFRLK